MRLIWISADPHGVIVVAVVCWLIYVYLVFTLVPWACSRVNQWWDPPTVDEDVAPSEDYDGDE